ncbi:unnamed protein product [Effrenium voratum]|nr:unnamed protein product [Effrenium voratum]
MAASARIKAELPDDESQLQALVKDLRGRLSRPASSPLQPRLANAAAETQVDDCETPMLTPQKDAPSPTCSTQASPASLILEKTMQELAKPGVTLTDAEKELVEAWKKMGANRASEPEQPTPVVTPQKDQFLHRLEAHRAHEKWSQTSTHGGYYSESDMKKPMCDGGLNFSAKKASKVVQFCEEQGGNFLRRNRYDDEEVEYWVDYRTKGESGQKESEGIMEKKIAEGTTATMALSRLSSATDFTGDNGNAQKEAGNKGLDVLAKYMKECLSAKEDLLKFLSRLDTGAPTVQLECDKMQKVVTQLNQLYDDLANIQAEGKVTGMSPERQKDLEVKYSDIKRQVVLATSFKAKNRKLPKIKKETDDSAEPSAKKAPKPAANPKASPEEAKPKRKSKAALLKAKAKQAVCPAE